MLEHGGRLTIAAKQYGIPVQDWLDLSTGINPHGYPIPAIPASAWQRLPENEDGLKAAATAYFDSPHALAAAGTQAILQILPRLRTPCRVVMPAPTYAEHPRAWEMAGHTVTFTAPENILEAARHNDVLLLCNPNNPTGHLYNPDALLACHAELASRHGWLVVDEAFMDATPQYSVAPRTSLPGLIVLRGLGKFFGLAGARVGFALAWTELLEQLEEMLGPWPVGGPARLVAQQALSDTTWQQATRQQLLRESGRLAELLTAHGLPPTGSSVLFQWVQTTHAASLHHKLAQQGVLTRHFTTPSSLRFGLPGSQQAWQHLAQALSTATLSS